MKKISFTLFVMISLLSFSFNSNAFPGLDKVKKNIIGTWKFKHYFRLSTSDAPNAPANDFKESNDPREQYTAYTFLENGKLKIWSLDKSKCNIPTQIVNWVVYTKKDSHGAEFTVLLMTDADDLKGRDNQLLSQSPGIHYVITGCNKWLEWIKIDKKDQYWGKEWQAAFEKIPDLPKD